MNFAHLPTLLLIIGYPVYWIELAFIRQPGGHTSPLAAVLFLVCAAFYAWHSRPGLRKNCWRPTGWFEIAAGLVVLLILSVTFYASLLPPHLSQEFDVINYHLTAPRQHLLTGSFAHLSWSSADLYIAPLSYALAPYWLVTDLPNKIPQFLICLGLLAVLGRLTMRFTGSRQAVAVLLTAVLGLHAVGIQAGTAMLDLALTYLFFAAIDSWLEGRPALAAVELALFFWSKPFMPLWMLAVLLICGVTIVGFSQIMKSPRFRFAFGEFRQSRFSWRLCLVVFVLSSIVFAGPFVARSMQAAGTPLYPFACGIANQELKGSPVCQKADEILNVQDQYGQKRGPLDFALHFWLLAVPEKGVNNRFDYPLGLSYLLLLGPFFVLLFNRLRERIFPVFPIFCVIYWALWWTVGSQQSRFLFVPVIGLLLVTVAELEKRQRLTTILRSALVLSLALTSLSIVRAHKADWGRSAFDVLRPEDQSLVRQAARIGPGEVIETDRFDAGFAAFLVDVKAKSVFVIDRNP